LSRGIHSRILPRRGLGYNPAMLRSYPLTAALLLIPVAHLSLAQHSPSLTESVNAQLPANRDSKHLRKCGEFSEAWERLFYGGKSTRQT
jgi:hypothetical protein